MNKIKIIWDFRGPVSHKIANHHEKHLQEFFKKENKKLYESGIEKLTEMHSIAYSIIDQNDLNEIKITLRPNRAQQVN
ncbi:MAG: hypothetical protein P8L90_05375 [Flavobacteriaceae bacterium]|nr:hypothetical protein [Flavobacteriaceae bacterium]